MLLVFTHPRCAGPSGCVERFPVGWRVARFGRQARTTVYPCGTSHGPKHLLPYTPRASGTPTSRAHPSNERCLHRITRRHNGGSLRPRLLHSRGSDRASFVSWFFGSVRDRASFVSWFFGSVRHLRPHLTRAPPPSHDVAPSNRPAAASPSPRRPPAVPPGPRNATTRSAASAPTPRCRS